MTGRGLVMAAAIAALVAACGGSAAASPAASVPEPTAAQASAPAATPMPTSTTQVVLAPTPPPLPGVEDLGGSKRTVSAFIDWLVMADGTAWIAIDDDMAPLDPVSGEPGTPVTVDGAICTAPAYGYGSIWVGTCENRTLTRIDVDTHEAVRIAIPGDIPEEGSVAAGEGAAWVVTRTPELVKVSRKTNRVVGHWPLPAGAAAVRAGLGALWVTVPDADALLRIDPADPTEITTITVGHRPRFLAVGEGAAWTLDSSSGTVTKVGADGTVLATIKVADREIRGGDMAVGGGYAWARTSDSLIVRIDPSTGDTLRIGPRSGSGSVAAGDAAVWITAHDVYALWRLPLPIRTP